MDDDARAQILARARARKPKRKPRDKKQTATPPPGADPETTPEQRPRSRAARGARTRHAWDGHGSAAQEDARRTVPVAGPGARRTTDTPQTPPADVPRPSVPPPVPARPTQRPVAPAPDPTHPPPELPPLQPPPARTTTEGYWNDDFAILHDFVSTHGVAIPRSGQVWRERPLGRWVEQQRRRRARLSVAQTTALEGLPGWCWSSVDAVWEEHLRALEAWVSARGWLPPPTLRLDNGLRIGPWMEHQRRLFRAGRLSEERATRLSAIPEWTWSREG